MVYESYLANVNSCILFAERVPITEFSYDRDRVEARVLRKSGGDDLERVGKRLEAICLHAFEGSGIL